MNCSERFYSIPDSKSPAQRQRPTHKLADDGYMPENFFGGEVFYSAGTLFDLFATSGAQGARKGRGATSPTTPKPLTAWACHKTAPELFRHPLPVVFAPC